jgi:2-methylisocitrate lyase-like PEP mutase family enzyme
VLGRRDGMVMRQEALDHAPAIAAATDLPVSAHLEKGFDDAPEDAAETIRLAAGVGLAAARSKTSAAIRKSRCSI